MKPAPFEYSAPNSLEAALEEMAQHGGEAKILAGGQSLVPAMNFRVLQPTRLIDLNGIGELDGIRRENGELRIRAMTRQRTLEQDPRLPELVPLLNECMPFIAHPQIRNRGTVGGSMVHADPAAELPVAAIALDARFKAQSTSGVRWIPADSFFTGMFATALQPEEILTEVAFPVSPAARGWSFQEFARRHGDYALMGLAALVSVDSRGVCQKARLVYLNAGDGPVDARRAAEVLVGEPASEAAFEAAAAAAAGEISPMGSVHATEDYQRHLARVLTRRALKHAFQRADPGAENGSQSA